MKTLSASRRAFTLIELIGVLAIIAIMAAVLAPNVIRQIDRAAVKAEQENLQKVGDIIKLYLRDNYVAPTAANWTTVLATYSDLRSADLATNTRGVARVYLTDPSTTPTRIIILSAMRSSLSLPSSSSITTTGFQAIWDTAENTVPPTSSWSGWSNYNSSNIEFLVIQRVNLTPVYRTDLQTYTITLVNNSNVTSTTTTTTTTTTTETNGNAGGNGNGNGNAYGVGNGNGNGNGNGGGGSSGTGNTGGTTASYRVVRSNGTYGSSGNIAPTDGPIQLTDCRPNDRIELYRASGGSAADLDFVYVVGAGGKTLQFIYSSDWIPE